MNFATMLTQLLTLTRLKQLQLQNIKIITWIPEIGFNKKGIPFYETGISVLQQQKIEIIDTDETQTTHVTDDRGSVIVVKIMSSSWHLPLKKHAKYFSKYFFKYDF